MLLFSTLHIYVFPYRFRVHVTCMGRLPTSPPLAGPGEFIRICHCVKLSLRNILESLAIYLCVCMNLYRQTFRPRSRGGRCAWTGEHAKSRTREADQQQTFFDRALPPRPRKTTREALFLLDPINNWAGQLYFVSVVH